jgi:hypothetical protein
MTDLVYCEKHNPLGTAPVAHVERPDCVWPHFAGSRSSEPSMSAVETLDPREAVVAS